MPLLRALIDDIDELRGKYMISMKKRVNISKVMTQSMVDQVLKINS